MTVASHQNNSVLIAPYYFSSNTFFSKHLKNHYSVILLFEFAMANSGDVSYPNTGSKVRFYNEPASTDTSRVLQDDADYDFLQCPNPSLPVSKK